MPKDIAPAIAECRRLALEHVPYAVERLRSLLDSKDERVVCAAAVAIMDRAGLQPFRIEPERVEVTAAVDMDALRAELARRVEGLVLALPAATADAPAVVEVEP